MENNDEDNAYEIVLRAKSWPFVNYSEHIKKAKPKKELKEIQKMLNEGRNEANRFILGEKSEKVIDSIKWILECEEIRIWAEACEQNWALPTRQTSSKPNISNILANIDHNSMIVDFFFTDKKLYAFKWLP